MRVTRVRLHIAKQVLQIHAADARRVPSRSVTDSRKSNATSWSLSAAGGIVLLGAGEADNFLLKFRKGGVDRSFMPRRPEASL
jgi:hypothetical protein